MIIATLLSGAALQAALPPLPPLPPAPPSAVAPPAPPFPPLPPMPPIARGDGQQVMSFDNDGQHVTIIKRRAGPHEARPVAVVGRNDENVLRFKDAEGRDVMVVTDKPITRADAEKMERDMRAKIPGITAKARADADAYRAHAETYRRDALRYGEEARAAGAVDRAEGQKARDYAQVIVKQMKDERGNWRFETGPSTGVFRQGEFPGAGDIKALRDEVHALRVEIDELRAQSKGGVTH